MGEQSDHQADPVEVTMPAQVVWRLTNSIRPDPKNTRVHNDQQLDALKASLEAYGFPVPIVIDSDGVIGAGEGRWKAAKLLEWKEVPTILADHLDDAQRRAFSIVDNRTYDMGLWDDQKVQEALEGMDAEWMDKFHFGEFVEPEEQAEVPDREFGVRKQREEQYVCYICPECGHAGEVAVSELNR